MPDISIPLPLLRQLSTPPYPTPLVVLPLLPLSLPLPLSLTFTLPLPHPFHVRVYMVVNRWVFLGANLFGTGVQT